MTIQVLAATASFLGVLAVVRVAARLLIKLINVMLPPARADFEITPKEPAQGERE